MKNSLKILSVVSMSLLLGNAMAFASKHPRGTKFSATVEDGTPKTLHAKAHADGEDSGESEEYLGPSDEDRVAPKVEVTEAPSRVEKRLAARKLSRPKSITKTITITESTEGGDEVMSSDLVSDTSAAETNLKAENEVLAERIAKLEGMILEMKSAEAKQENAAGEEQPVAEKSEEEKPAIPAAPAEETKNLRTAGEKVPQDKIDDIAERLKYANMIIKKYGIAYDYRVMTLKDFKRVYAKLEQKSKSEKEQLQSEN